MLRKIKEWLLNLLDDLAQEDYLPPQNWRVDSDGIIWPKGSDHE